MSREDREEPGSTQYADERVQTKHHCRFKPAISIFLLVDEHKRGRLGMPLDVGHKLAGGRDGVHKLFSLDVDLKADEP